MVNEVINGFVKVSGQYCLKLLSYDLSNFFFEELKKLSPPKLNHILGERREKKLWLGIIFNPTAQFSVISKILSFALTPLFFKITKNKQSD